MFADQTPSRECGRWSEVANQMDSFLTSFPGFKMFLTQRVLYSFLQAFLISDAFVIFAGLAETHSQDPGVVREPSQRG